MRDSKLTIALLAILAFIAIGFLLHILQPILLPFVVAVFLAQLFGPLTAALRRRRVPAALSILLVLLLVSGVLAILSHGPLLQRPVLHRPLCPRYQTKLKELLTGLSGWLVAAFPGLSAQIQNWHWGEAVGSARCPAFAGGDAGLVPALLQRRLPGPPVPGLPPRGQRGLPGKLRRAMPRAGRAARPR